MDFEFNNQNFILRPLEREDYLSYIKLLSQLTDVGSVSKEQFEMFVDSLNSEHHVEVIATGKEIIACATMFIENKLIHSCSSYAHIEEVIVDKKYQGYGFGKLMINRMIWISGNRKCYKIVLDCSEKNVKFYEKCGLKKNGVQMIAKL